MRIIPIPYAVCLTVCLTRLQIQYKTRVQRINVCMRCADDSEGVWMAMGYAQVCDVMWGVWVRVYVCSDCY